MKMDFELFLIAIARLRIEASKGLLIIQEKE